MKAACNTHGIHGNRLRTQCPRRQPGDRGEQLNARFYCIFEFHWHMSMSLYVFRSQNIEQNEAEIM